MPITFTYLGHSGFIITDGQHRICVDPFLTGNEKAVHSIDDVKCDLVCITHGHSDHFGPDTIAIAQNNDAPIMANFEICNYITQEMGYEKVDPGNPGGRIYTDFGHVAFTPAIHSSSYEGHYMGVACGLIFDFDGTKIYHLGDTALQGDFKLTGEIARPKVALIPCGDRFTMGPDLATLAAEMLRPDVAIPIHFGTFPPIDIDISDFKPKGIPVHVMKPGDQWTYED